MYGRRGQASVYQVVSIFLDMLTTFVFGSAIELRSAEIYESFIIGNECSTGYIIIVFIEEPARIVQHLTGNRLFSLLQIYQLPSVRV